LLELGDMTGRLQLARDTNSLEPMGTSELDRSSASLSLGRRLDIGVRLRDEILKHVDQQVKAASPFECICLPYGAVDLETNLSSIVNDFATRVATDSTVFVAAHRLELIGLEAFQRVWGNVHALALYDWNGSGLQGLQFSSTINRLICRHAIRVHSWTTHVEESGECW